MPPPAVERPPYYAVLQHRPAAAGDAALQFEAIDRLAGLAAAEPGFLGVEDVEDEWGEGFTICYWREASALRRWHADAATLLPETLAAETVIGPTGCLWPWLRDVQQAQQRRAIPFAAPPENPLDPTPDLTVRALRRNA